jgi:hypothetical protein
VNWSESAAMVAALSTVFTLVSGWVALSVRLSLAEMREAMEKMRGEFGAARGRDMAEMRAWINGSFLRSAEAIAEMKAFEIRLDYMEKEINNAR